MSNQEPVSDWGNTLFSDIGNVGKFFAKLGLIIIVIISVFLIVLGVTKIVKNDDNKYMNVNGKIISTECIQNPKNPNDTTDTHKCSIVVEYTINDKIYTKELFLNGSNKYIVNEPIDLKVEKNNYNNAGLATMKESTTGWILIAISLGLFGIAYLNYYLTHNYRSYAAVSGVSNMVNLFR
jgi:hypothetical protein